MQVLQAINHQELSRCLFDESNDAFIIFDPNGNRILEVNPTTQRLTGLRKKQLLDMNLDDLLHSENASAAQKLLYACEHTCFFHSKEGYNLRRSQGEPIPVNVTVTRIHAEPETLGLLVVRDVTERRQAEQERQRHRDELAHVSRLSTVGELVAGIAHELNQPLYAITNYSGACAKTLESNPDGQLQKLQNWIRQIGDQAARAGEMLRRLRNFSRKAEPHRSTIDLNDLVRESVELLNAETSQLRAEIEFDLHQPGCLVLADRIQIQQTIVNLMLNAYKAIENADNRRVVIHTSEIPEFGKFSLTDSGPGLPAEGPEKIFEAFFTTKPDGMGLGLPISRSIIEAHGGKLWAEDHPDGGATFQFTLSLAGAVDA